MPKTTKTKPTTKKQQLAREIKASHDLASAWRYCFRPVIKDDSARVNAIRS